MLGGRGCHYSPLAGVLNIRVLPLSLCAQHSFISPNDGGHARNKSPGVTDGVGWGEGGWHGRREGINSKVVPFVFHFQEGTLSDDSMQQLHTNGYVRLPDAAALSFTTSS